MNHHLESSIALFEKACLFLLLHIIYIFKDNIFASVIQYIFIDKILPLTTQSINYSIPLAQHTNVRLPYIG